MERLFRTHNVRKTCELTDNLWDFYPYDFREKSKIAIPSCWQNYPGMREYGEAILHMAVL